MTGREGNKRRVDFDLKGREGKAREGRRKEEGGPDRAGRK